MRFAKEEVTPAIVAHEADLLRSLQRRHDVDQVHKAYDWTRLISDPAGIAFLFLTHQQW